MVKTGVRLSQAQNLQSARLFVLRIGSPAPSHVSECCPTLTPPPLWFQGGHALACSCRRGGEPIRTKGQTLRYSRYSIIPIRTKDLAWNGIFKLLRSPGINSKDDNPISTRFLASTDCSKIPNSSKQFQQFQGINSVSIRSLAGRYDQVRQPYSYSVPSPHRLFKNSSAEQCWNFGILEQYTANRTGAHVQYADSVII